MKGQETAVRGDSFIRAYFASDSRNMIPEMFWKTCNCAFRLGLAELANACVAMHRGKINKGSKEETIRK